METKEAGIMEENNESNGEKEENNRPGYKELGIAQLDKMNRTEVGKIAKELNIQGYQKYKKNDLMYKIMEVQAANMGLSFSCGILEILSDGYGFLRGKTYLPGSGDIYISQSQIKRFNLRVGDFVAGKIRPTKEGEKYYGLLKVMSVNEQDPELARRRVNFDKLTPIFPNEKFKLETIREEV